MRPAIRCVEDLTSQLISGLEVGTVSAYTALYLSRLSIKRAAAAAAAAATASVAGLSYVCQCQSQSSHQTSLHPGAFRRTYRPTELSPT